MVKKTVKKKNSNYAMKMQKIWAKLLKPLPEGMTPEDYFSKNYEKASENPYVYRYMQFSQLNQLYEEKNMRNFDKFIESYLAK